jgi:hypothetical protein
MINVHKGNTGEGTGEVKKEGREGKNDKNTHCGHFGGVLFVSA